MNSNVGGVAERPGDGDAGIRIFREDLQRDEIESGRRGEIQWELRKVC